MARPLAGRVAVVAGATRGVGRGIACMLGEAGATVYCTGRSVRGSPNTTGYFAGRPESIEETAEMVKARGGIGIPVRVDHLDPQQVDSLAKRLREEQKGRLDVLVNDMSEGELHEFKPFWKLSLEKGFRMYRQGVHSHLITCRHLVPLMVERGRGLVVEIGDGHTLGYRGTLFYDLIKVTVTRIAWAMAEELREHGVAAVAVTPGFTRTEAVLEQFGVTEANWREGGRQDAGFLASETPYFVGRGIAALAADPDVLEKSGGLYGSWELAREYGFTDVDGSRPDFGKHWDENYAETFGRPRTGFRWTLTRQPSERALRKRPADRPGAKRRSHGSVSSRGRRTGARRGS